MAVSMDTADHVEEFIRSVPTGCFIDGEWVPAAQGRVFAVVDPATELLLTDVADGSEVDALRAVDAAARALPAWSARAPRDRSEILRRAFELMIERAEEIASLIVLENGKTLRDARGEVTYAAEYFRWYAEEAVRLGGEVSMAPSGNNRILVTQRPIGVALLITPWNFPAAMLTRKIGPALAAGCTVVCKPAPETPLTALYLARLLAEAGVPNGVVNVLPTDHAAEVVEAMLRDDRVRKLSFTGSTEVGRILLRLAAAKVISCSMELGGNAPFLVFEDADLDAAVAGAMIAKMRNGGEACTAANRFYVQSAVADQFSSKLAAAMASLKMGPGLEDGTELGPLVNRDGLDKVRELVDAAIVDGAHAIIGGEAPSGTGYFYPPTVLTNISPDSDLLRTEIFGPVAPIIVFEEEAEAIAMANDTEYGLVSYVYTADFARGLRVSEALEAGMVGLNRGLVSDPAAPFGGSKQSGLGREGAHEGMLEYTEMKYIACSW